MNRYYVEFFTETEHRTQFMTVEATDKGAAKSIVRAKFNEQVYFISVMKA